MLNLPSNQRIAEMPLAASRAHASPTIASDWREALPLLAGEGVTLRALRATDAPTLLAMLTPQEVARFISPPPTTVEQFERFIAWTHGQQAEGRYVCFGIVPAGRADACEGLLRQAFRRGETYMDQMLWAMVRSDWTLMNARCDGHVH